jgi:hypothetical protein
MGRMWRSSFHRSLCSAAVLTSKYPELSKVLGAFFSVVFTPFFGLAYSFEEFAGDDIIMMTVVLKLVEEAKKVQNTDCSGTTINILKRLAVW